MVHLWPALVSATDSVMHLLQNLISFVMADASEEHFLPIGTPIEHASLVDIGRESSL